MKFEGKQIDDVVLFDGVCTLCNSSVDFIVRHEKGDRLLFASLQSDVGKQIIANSGLDEVPDSILFYTDKELYSKSTAVLKIAKHLSRPFSLAQIFIVVPKPFRDVVYDWIAKNRYQWFGKKETCRIPTPEERAKFLG
ncbi:MAG: thiol-disulfide oxidoreductase DCC family protein [Bacteroidia bacterium]